jgi:hypothetical protein
MRRRWLAVAAAVLLAACGGGDDLSDLAGGIGTRPRDTPPTSDASATASTSPAPEVDLVVGVDLTARRDEVSPLILGVSGDLSAEEMRDAGITLDSWGGNPASRFNYLHGHAWNAAADWEFRNTSYGWTSDAFRSFTDVNAEAGVATRVAVPTLGWVARDGNHDTCSFPDGRGGCRSGEGLTCDNRDAPVADPNVTSVRSTPDMVAGWIADLLAEDRELRFIAMDNEPDLWGHTHYDVHPDCPTFQEIVDRYLEYATAIREVAPDAELMGPAMCCWYDYWRIGPQAPDRSGDDFLTWFLRQLRAHDEETGIRTIDVVDVHFYPQTGVYNDKSDPETNARRLRSTRALWDPGYLDESWIRKPIRFIPRMKDIIERSYPGLPLAISEWNFGADTTMNGALTIAIVLGTYATEGVYAAAYWRSPPAGSPGYHAFKMFGNYDDAGARFSGQALALQLGREEQVRAFAAVDGDVLKIVLVNPEPDAVTVGLTIDGTTGGRVLREFRYGEGNLDGIEEVDPATLPAVTVPASTIELLEIDLA